jgi:hypothetical protein
MKTTYKVSGIACTYKMQHLLQKALHTNTTEVSIENNEIGGLQALIELKLRA